MERREDSKKSMGLGTLSRKEDEEVFAAIRANVGYIWFGVRLACGFFCFQNFVQEFASIKVSSFLDS